jgi:hypothetical protein
MQRLPGRRSLGVNRNCGTGAETNLSFARLPSGRSAPTIPTLTALSRVIDLIGLQ